MERRRGWPRRLPARVRGFASCDDPRTGATLAERINLRGNPAIKEDWYTHPRTGEPIDFVYFARTEGRFARRFDADGRPDAMLLAGQEDRLANWRLLQQLAGVR